MIHDLSDESVQKIADAVAKNNSVHTCRFVNVKQEDMAEAVKFYRHFNNAMEGSKRVIWHTILALGVTGIIACVWIGFVGKLKDFFMGPGGPVH